MKRKNETSRKSKCRQRTARCLPGAATGDLTIHGTTHPVVLDVEYGGRARDPWGGERAGFSAKVSFDRKDFGLTWNAVLEAGGVLVGDKVEIVIELEAVKAKAAAAA